MLGGGTDNATAVVSNQTDVPLTANATDGSTSENEDDWTIFR